MTWACTSALLKKAIWSFLMETLIQHINKIHLDFWVTYVAFKVASFRGTPVNFSMNLSKTEQRPNAQYKYMAEEMVSVLKCPANSPYPFCYMCAHMCTHTQVYIWERDIYTECISLKNKQYYWSYSTCQTGSSFGFLTDSTLLPCSTPITVPKIICRLIIKHAKRPCYCICSSQLQ